jgi:hypothetical protein
MNVTTQTHALRWVFIAMLISTAPPMPGSGAVARELENRARISIGTMMGAGLLEASLRE